MRCREPLERPVTTSFGSDPIRQSQYLNNRIEQDHRRIKRRVRPIQSFKSFNAAAATFDGIEIVHMMRKRQSRFAFNPNPSLKQQFETIAT